MPRFEPTHFRQLMQGLGARREERGVHFQLPSGLHVEHPYNLARAFYLQAMARKLGENMVQEIAKQGILDLFDLSKPIILIAPAFGGIHIQQALAQVFPAQDIRTVIISKKGGVLRFVPAFEFDERDKTAINSLKAVFVDDILYHGTTLQAVINEFPGFIKGVAVGVDARKEDRPLGFPLAALARDPQSAYPSSRCDLCRKGLRLEDFLLFNGQSELFPLESE